MNEKKFNDYLKRLEKYKEEITSSKEASQQFLVRAGILTEKGELSKNYKHLCIPKDQA